MKVLFVNTYDIEGGAALAAYRLFRSVVNSGVEADFFCMHKKSGDNRVFNAENGLRRLAYRASFYLERKRLYEQYKSRSNVSKWSFNILPNLIKLPLEKKYDLIHLHWIGDSFISMRALGETKIPVLWTLHDSWAFTGGCHVPYNCVRYLKSCGDCPQLKSGSENDLSRAIYNAKQKCYESLAGLKIITPSEWLAKCARNSSLLSKKDIDVIPNGIDGDIFKPMDKKEARKRLGLDPDKKIILFSGMAAVNNVNKGFHHLVSALKMLYNQFDDIELLVLGDLQPANAPNLEYKINYSGKIADQSVVALYNSAADLMVLPSIQENLPNTIIEAFACATPAIAFNIGGIGDIIDNKVNGCLIKPFDISEFSSAISWMLQDSARMRALGNSAREKFTKKFTVESMGKNYIELYNRMISGKK